MPLAALLQLILLGAIWGASFLFIKIGVSEIGPLTFATMRVLIGALTLLVVLGARRQKLPRQRQVWGRFLVMGAIGTALPFVAISWGTQYIDSGLSAILNASMPLFTCIIAALWGDESMSVTRLGGVLCGLVGVALLTLPQLEGGLHIGIVGELAIVAASLSYAVAIVYARHALSDQPPLTASFGQVGSCLLMLLPLSLVAERPWLYHPSSKVVVSLLAIGIFGTGVAYILYYRLLRQIGATGTSLVTYIVPLFGIFWGWTILGERLSWHAFAALLLIFVGLLLVSRRPGARRAKPLSAAPLPAAEN